MPKVKHSTLILFTGFIWLIASLILFRRAYSWVEIITPLELVIGLTVTFPLALIKIYFIFNKITMKNIDRILSFTQKRISVWEFHLKRDKLLIILMIVIGSILRHMNFIPKFIIFPIYVGIGIAMFYVWLLYLKTYFETKT
jgi:hypothetical protein